MKINQIYTPQEITELAKWSIPDGELQRGKLKNLKINGREFGELTDTRFQYNISVAPNEKESRKKWY